MVPRPKKPRHFAEELLADNLYPDSKKRYGYWRYVRPDGTSRTFTAQTVKEANAIAEEANDCRDTYIPSKPEQQDRQTFAFHLPYYFEEREDDDPGLKKKQSWQNRKNRLKQFCREFDTPTNLTTFDDIKDWWRTLTHAQQGSRRPEFKRFFNYLIGEGACPKLDYNPFTTADDKPKLNRRGMPSKKRARIKSIDDFWKLYDEAGRAGYEGLQVALGLSLLTSMRESDICAIEIDKHIDDNLLRKMISKSAEQVGELKAERLCWDIGAYDQLRRLIKKGKELSMKHGRCPFLISYKPERKVLGKQKRHYNQMLPRKLIEQFSEIRHVLPVQLGRTPVTFHEVRSLFSKLAEDAGYQIDQIQEGMAHKNKATTLVYQSEHKLPYKQSQVILDETILGRSF